MIRLEITRKLCGHYGIVAAVGAGGRTCVAVGEELRSAGGAGEGVHPRIFGVVLPGDLTVPLGLRLFLFLLVGGIYLLIGKGGAAVFAY